MWLDGESCNSSLHPWRIAMPQIMTLTTPPSWVTYEDGRLGIVGRSVPECPKGVEFSRSGEAQGRAQGLEESRREEQGSKGIKGEAESRRGEGWSKLIVGKAGEDNKRRPVWKYWSSPSLNCLKRPYRPLLLARGTLQPREGTVNLLLMPGLWVMFPFPWGIWGHTQIYHVWCLPCCHLL